LKRGGQKTQKYFGPPTHFGKAKNPNIGDFAGNGFFYVLELN
jgi:hypothetical protein